MLETEGIEVPLFGHIRSSIVQVTGDNLGIHACLVLWSHLVLVIVAGSVSLRKWIFKLCFFEDDPRVIL